MNGFDLREIARALGGEVQGRQVVCPGPNHSRRDRSLSIRLSPQSPTGYVVFSHAGDDFAECRDYVAQHLGLDMEAWRTRGRDRAPPRPISIFKPREAAPEADTAARVARAVAIWDAAEPAAGSLVETYLSSRRLRLDLVDKVHEVIRFHPRCPWRDEEADRTIYVPAMVAAMRGIESDAVTAVHRTRLTAEGAKVDRRMLGIAAGAAVKLDGDEAVTMGLGIGEGIETVLAARQFGFRPAWALTSAGAVATFPVLAGVEHLTLFAENDPTSDRAINDAAARWHHAGREVTIVSPDPGYSDMNDCLRGVA